MPFLPFDAVITKVFDLLRQDARTLDVDWHNGRRALPQLQRLPAGNVYMGPWTTRPMTMPAGEEASLRVVIELVYASHDGAVVAEQDLRLGVDAVQQVLIDNWDLGLSFAYPELLSGTPTINPEATPAMAGTAIFLDVKIIPGD